MYNHERDTKTAPPTQLRGLSALIKPLDGAGQGHDLLVHTAPKHFLYGLAAIRAWLQARSRLHGDAQPSRPSISLASVFVPLCPRGPLCG
jgi:hypothetical protein